MRRRVRHLTCAAAVAFLAAGPTSAQGEPFDGRHLTGLGEVRYHHLESELLGRGFHVYVRLPESYAAGQVRYPTVYLLDGGVTFPLLAGYYRYLSLGEEVPDMILVGIAYGTGDSRQGNFRGTDFTAPSEEREHYGGAARFQEVLRSELLPMIERRYRSDAARRVIFGQSLGGQFALFTALTDPGLFHGHIASNPALHRNLEFFLRWHAVRADDGNAKRPRVFVSSGELDQPRFREPAKRWIEQWTGRPDAAWDLKTETLAGHGHFSPAPVAFRRGIRWIFGGGLERPEDR